MTSDRYVVVRDDSGQKSLSLNERDFLRSQSINAKKTVRLDGRRDNELRKVRLQLGRWDNGAKCTVQWGMGTRVTALCSAELVPPSPDHPNDGVVDFSVDLSPMAGTSFRQANPVGTATGAPTSSARGPNFSDNNQRLQSNRILRCVERIILVGGALDTEALVLIPGKFVWRLSVALTVLDDGGNIIDACTLAAISALRHYRKPKVDLSGNGDQQSGSNDNVLPVIIPSTVQEATPLPLHHTPLSITFALIADGEVTSNTSSSASAVSILVDPSDREELVQLGSLTIATNIHSELCLLDFGGGCELLPSQLRECWGIGENAAKQLCKLVEDTLLEADEQAREERLQLLQGQQHGNIDSIPAPKPPPGVSPYVLGIDGDDEMLGVEPEVDTEQNMIAQSQAEEAYRNQALDYTKGHVASVVREDSVDDKRQNSRQGAGSLLSAMLKSAKQEATTDEAPDSKLAASENKEQAIISEEAPAADEKMSEADSSEPPQTEVKAGAKNKSTEAKASHADSDDEEEPPVQLQNEFDDVPSPAAAKKEEPKVSKAPVAPKVDPDIADLSMAVKKKKKKKGKK